MASKKKAREVLFVDRSGAPVVPGVVVELVHCVGRYGEMAHERGEVVSLDFVNLGVVLKLERESRMIDPRTGGVSYVRIGEDRYFALPVGDVFERPMRCVSEFKDFEHGHTAYVEVVKGV